MAVLKMFTAPVDLSAQGGGFDTTTTTNFDNTRVEGAITAGAAAQATFVHPQAAGDTTWYHFAFAKSESTNNNLDTDCFVMYEPTASGGSAVASMNILNGNPRFGAIGDATNYTSTIPLNLNVLYQVDIEVTVTAPLITVNGYVNNVLIGTITAPNTTSGHVKPGQATMQNNDNFATFYFSEGVVTDEDTRGWRIRELRPTSFGVDQSWDGNVDNVIDADLATGLSTSTNDARTSFGVSNLENVSGGDIINRVVAQTYAQRGASGLTRINHYFRYEDATRQDGGDITVGTTGDWYISEFTQNPKTSLAWVPADLAGIQLGIRART